MSRSNAQRNQDIRHTIQRKIDVLRSYLEDPPVTGTFVPKSVRQFRSWSDPRLDLKPIGSPGTLNRKQSPHNADLIDQLHRVLEELARQKKRPRKKPLPLGDKIKAVSHDLETQKKLVSRLTSQLQETRHALKTAESCAASAIAAKERADKTVAELRKALSNAKKSGLHIVAP